jgi:aspartyl-tRNA(Asn)/glutamyl-tRNA(Gln) amidotransferase subunit B
MQDGGMRCDVNVSVRRKGDPVLGTKVEIKNMNSFSAMQKAIEYETQRQGGLLAAGRGSEIRQETRLFDEAAGATAPMRVKEGLADYRYFAEPDLPPGGLPAGALERAAAALAARAQPAALRATLAAAGLPAADVLLLTDDVGTARFFEAVLEAGAPAKAAANWVVGDVMAAVRALGEGGSFATLPLLPSTLAQMVALIEDGTLSGKLGKALLPLLLAGRGAGDGGVAALAKAEGLVQVSDPAAIETLVDGVLAAFPAQLAEYRGGKTKLQGFFVGELMKASKGAANPGLLNKELARKLKGGE